MLLLAKAMIFLHMFVGVILIGIILLQRGRGGGLAGAFGGMGGQSAFGTKAGDVFTRITIVLATIWIVLAGLCILAVSNSSAVRYKGGAAAGVTKAPANDGESEKTDAPDAAKPGATGRSEMKPVEMKDGEKKDGAATDGTKADTSESKIEPSKETKKVADEKVDSQEKPADAKAGAEPAVPSPQTPKASEGKVDGGAAAPDKPVEKKPE